MQCKFIVLIFLCVILFVRFCFFFFSFVLFSSVFLCLWADRMGGGGGVVCVVSVVCGPSHTPHSSNKGCFSFIDKLVLCYLECIFMLMCM